MSDAKHEKQLGPNDPEYYAPRELRDRLSGEKPSPTLAPNDGWRPRATTEGPPLQPLSKPARRQDSEIFTKAVAQAMQEARDMAPVEAPSVLRDLSGRRALFQQIIRFSIAVAIAATIATLLVMAIPSSQRSPGQDSASLTAAWQSVKSSVAPAPQPAPPPRRTATLAVQDGSGFTNDPVPLGIHVGAPPPDAFVSISGLTAGSRLTSGRRVGGGEWRVSATEISGVSVIPPEGFTGQMLVTAELRDATGAAITGSSTRLTWQAAPNVAPSLATVAPRAVMPAPAPAVAAPPVVAPPPVAAVPPVAVAAAVPAAIPAQPQSDTVRSLDPREIAALIRRGQDLLASGDVQSARLLLMRGAEARDGRAALLVGTTYDPALLRQIGADGPLADPAQARIWYQRAKEWGEPDAQRKLEALALSR
ncbi:SEL1-like repeat protein [Bradyrhizobium roseum]|uniref:hypothetical protein n=1 Tax=Bradyrhizobium roseum TaxID=3056648 RepID=UPI00260BC7BD|nr:hypothetical protein [Bradyrhizobium roseus]WKA30360.1 hypothetical protein QUH67_09415 [Bradyrhizobium roseus]